MASSEQKARKTCKFTNVQNEAMVFTSLKGYVCLNFHPNLNFTCLMLLSGPSCSLGWFFNLNLNECVCCSHNAKAKKKCMCVSGFSSEKNRYGRSALSFYFIELFFLLLLLFFFYGYCIFITFSPIFQHICQYFAHNSQ